MVTTMYRAVFTELYQLQIWLQMATKKVTYLIKGENMIDIQCIKERISIETVLNYYGYSLERDNKMLCPFHDEKTPSMSVDTEINLFNCFGCGESGTVIDFVMKKESLSIPDAVSFLAGSFLSEGENEAYSTNTKIRSYKKAKPKKEPVIDEKSQAVLQIFYDSLSLTDSGRNYMNGRGIQNDTLETFGIKSIDSSKPVFDKLREQFLNDELKASGIFSFSEPSVIFPVFDVDGKVIYLSNRVLNSANKNRFRNLKGIKAAFFTGDIQKYTEIFVFEGVIDTLSYYELFGKDNFITTYGVRAFRKVKKQYPDKNIVYVFDNDEAGNIARETFIKEVENENFDMVSMEYLDWEEFFSQIEVAPCKDLNDALIVYLQKIQEQEISDMTRKDRERR